MATSKPTPEEKLFAVIQGAAQKPLRGKPRALSLATVAARLSMLIGPVDLPRINQGLAVLIGGLALACVSNPLMMRPRVDRLLGRIEPRGAPVIPAPLQGLKTLEAYLGTMGAQDPFRIGEQPLAVSPDQAATAPAHADPKTLLGDAKLVGISFGENPTAMVEQQKQTFFLKPGDVLGQLTVKEILKDHVVFRSGDQDVELF